MGSAHLIDTNVIIDAQAGVLPESGLYFLQNIVDERFLISFITYIEVLGYNDILPTTQEFMNLTEVLG